METLCNESNLNDDILTYGSFCTSQVCRKIGIFRVHLLCLPADLLKTQGRKTGAGNRNASFDHGPDGTVTNCPFSFVSYEIGGRNSGAVKH